MRLSEADHAAVTAAVAAAERETSGEIVTVVTARSNSYRDVALSWSVAAAFLALAVVAAFPGFFIDLLDRLRGGWGHALTPRTLLTILLLGVAATFAVTSALLAWMPLRIALTPGAVLSRRARAHAIDLFRVGAEKRTVGHSGVLLYLSLAEHRAEIVTDAAIHAKVRPEIWGEAMAALIDSVRAGRPGEGLAAAVGRIGAVLAEHFPRRADDTNELPDRLIEL
jgi:putative membrane protein